ncbi:MAG: DUF305 domain-containing protein [Gemmatimonadaceae bacterium]
MTCLRTSSTAAIVVFASISGCSTATHQSAASVPVESPAARVQADAGVQAFTPADVKFMQGMIHHHAQAVVMAGWAATHGASESVKTLAGRIDVGQRDEIAFMQRWLRERHLAAPDPSNHQMSMQGMPGMSMPDTLMPGMLTPQQMQQLDAARGAEFDRLFLTGMIQHHQGALTMVDKLFSSQGAGQEEYVFRFASDVSTDQTTEIDRMRLMLDALSPKPNRP